MIKRVFSILFLLYCANTVYAQSSTCNTALPFCTGSTYTFPASTNTAAPTGAYFDCLFSQPNPAFYYCEIDNPGNMTINIQGGSAGNTNDIDFICWGPFTNPTTMCNQLTAANVEDCSYSGTWNEFCDINGASTGDYYVILITNYSNQNCNITFSQTSGTATTNCCILGGDAGDDNTLNICDSDPVFNMETHLLGTPDNGGIWYDASWNAVSNQFNPSVNTTSTYAYIVQGSSAACPDDTSYLSVNITTSPIVSIPIYASMCDNAVILTLNTATPIGGTYLVNGNISTTFTPSVLNVGSNIIDYTYTDGNGCSATTSQNLIVDPSPFATATTTNASCNGFTDGTAILNITTGQTPFIEDWGIANPTALSAGSYTYTVTDANNCSFTDSIIIYEPINFNINVVTTDVSCNGLNNGTAVVKIQGNNTPTGTVSTQSYCSSNPGSSSYSNIELVQLFGDNFNIDNNTAGICDQYEDYTTSMYADITEGQNYNLTINLGDCSNMNYSAGGKIFIDWNIDGDFSDPNEEVATIPYGINSTISIPITVPYSGVSGPTRMRVVSQYISTQDVSLIGSCDAGVWAPLYTEPWFGATEDYSIVISAASITASYIWSNGLISDSISGLSAGIYIIDITNGNGCIITDSIIITQPSAISTVTSQNNISCDGGSDGSITLNIFGGITNYTITAAGLSQTLSGGISTYTTLNVLSAANYPYTISDSNGCVYTDNITLTSPSPISVTETINNVNCYAGNDGNVILSISGGIPTYTENWGLNNSSSLSVGTYNYTVTDNNGCTFTNSVSITEPTEIQISSTQNNVSTCGATDGNIDITTSGGTSPYIFSWNSGQTTEDIASLSAGTYTLTITDANLCNNTISITLTEPTSPIVSFTQINTNCNAATNGSIDITVSSGLSPYQFAWSNLETTEDIFNLNAGNYSVNITDANNCVIIENITITEPTAINVISTQTNVTNCNGNDGSVDISASGGTGNYTYLWSNGEITEDVFNLISGIHFVDVTDANGCTYNFSFTINEPSGITSSETITNVNCYGENSGSVILNVSGGQSPYIENWNGYNSLNLSVGTYTYIVTDNQNCNYTNSITITEPQELLVTENITNVFCKDENTGNVTLNISGGTSPFNENWGAFNPSSLIDGSYSYTVTDVNGCTFNNNIIITEPDSLLSNITTTDAICFGYNNGTALISSSGGTNPYTIDWFGQNNLSLTANNYSVLVVDLNGCTNAINFTISEPTEISITTNTTFTSCFGYNDGTAILTISGGFPPFTENWFGQNPLNLAAGNHPFSVTDSNNCVQQDIAVISEPTVITTNEITSDVLCSGENNGTAFLQITGGTSPYSENWNSADITQLPKGNYTYTVTDANGCTFNEYVIINEPTPISVSEMVSDANCFNSGDGQAILTINGGTSPYIEDWGTENPFSLSAGIYNYIITDLNSCTYSDSVLINQSNQVFMNFSLESPICINDTSALTVNVEDPLSSQYTVEINDGTISSYLLIDSLGNDVVTGEKFTFTPVTSTTFTIISITDENGCNSPVNQPFDVVINPLPILNLDIPNYCTQDSSRILNQGTPQGGNYFINGIPNSYFDIEKLEVETYTIQYSYTEPITTCFNSITTSVKINSSPYADFAFGPQPVNIDKPEVFFENKSDYYNYQIWTIEDGTTIINQDKFSHIFSDTGTFNTQLYIENQYGCSDSVNYNVVINPVFTIHIPTAFTPNNDGDNDTFGPVLRAGGYTNFSIKIFNQWGEKIFDEENLFWNGKVNEELAQNGAYTYTIIAFDFLDKPYIFTGNFLLIQ